MGRTRWHGCRWRRTRAVRAIPGTIAAAAAAGFEPLMCGRGPLPTSTTRSLMKFRDLRVVRIIDELGFVRALVIVAVETVKKNAIGTPARVVEVVARP